MGQEQTVSPVDLLSPNEFIQVCRKNEIENEEIAAKLRYKSLWNTISSIIAAASNEKQLTKAEGFYLVAEKVDKRIFAECQKAFIKLWIQNSEYEKMATVINFNQIRYSDQHYLTDMQLMKIIEDKRFSELSIKEDGRWIGPYLKEISSLNRIAEPDKFLEILEPISTRWSSVSDDPYSISKLLLDAIAKIKRQ